MTKVQLAHFRSAKGCVVSYCPVASSIGAQVLRRGGNAIDAAVATALALAVTYPQAGNLGGGGFMLIRSAEDQKVHYLDYRETAPMGVKEEMFVNRDNWRDQTTVIGGPAVCVPGTVAGLYAALERFGTWSWEQIVGSVIDLADIGIWLTTRQAAFLGSFEMDLSRFPTTQETFLSNGQAPMPGTRWTLSHLGGTLRLLAEHGPDVFYRGAIADRIVETVQAHGGVLDYNDLAHYSPRWREPLVGTAFGHTFYTSAPPSAGGLIIKISMAVLDGAGAQRLPAGSPERYGMLARAFRCAFELRRLLTGDPDTTPLSEQKQSQEVLDRCLAMASDVDALEQELGLGDPRESQETFDFHKNTTHLCAIDDAGNAVSNTYSLNTLFGSKLAPRETGFLLNNSLDDFSIGDAPNHYGLIDSNQNSLMPGRRPTGSMSPTIALDPDGEIKLVIGGSGGPRIPTVLVQLLVHILCDHEILPVAMRAPRVHQQQSSNEVWVERTLPERLQTALGDMGFDIVRRTQLGIGCGIEKWKGGVYAALDYRFGL